MSNNRIKSCECFRFPSGTTMCASERIRQKANIQIYKNNVLLNRKDQNRRVYSGTHNRLRTINGYKLHEESKANSDCGGNPDCIFSDKKAADYWIVGKPSAAALCSNRETITLEQALAQGGVGDCQDLVITQTTTTSIEGNGGNIIEYIAGLVIETGNTFTIAKTGKVTIATDIAATGPESVVGILVKSNGKLINNGTIRFEGTISSKQNQAAGIYNTGSFKTNGAITFESTISSDQSTAYGIDNRGSFEQSDGAITFEGDISGGQTVTYGIFNVGSSFEQSDGAITFEGAISGQRAAYGIYNTGSSFETNGAITFESAISGQTQADGIFNRGSFETNGTITFKGAISGEQSGAYGILNTGGSSFQTNGTITFKGAISSEQSRAYGILNDGSFEQSDGTITFKGAISSQTLTYGIFNRGSFETNGTITFVNETLDFSPQDATGISGNGEITYGNNIYYSPQT